MNNFLFISSAAAEDGVFAFAFAIDFGFFAEDAFAFAIDFGLFAAAALALLSAFRFCFFAAAAAMALLSAFRFFAAAMLPTFARPFH
eukprot:CAMPEP_0119550684 /NCGR_PEP_ID=MMETSP1352-20130426/4156_1 /TAXON_ID=265584 /ORGANISM="Stauroneis constricta, Strain CCMP1120" /LENGTH=86 /DNA_ID=CAMNT_0007596611 /DNA_START=95 /DNA_END=351 /DNA_ORIENTATION=+